MTNGRRASREGAKLAKQEARVIKKGATAVELFVPSEPKHFVNLLRAFAPLREIQIAFLN
jgi:hypothetical protein